MSESMSERMPSSSPSFDDFARRNLPPRSQWPEFLFELPELQFRSAMNCAVELLDRAVDERGWGERTAIRGRRGGLREVVTYRELRDRVDRIARVLVEDLGLVPGNRVLLHGPNSVATAAAWFAIVKAGGIVVATMPLLRAREIATIAELGQITHALCDRAPRRLKFVRRASSSSRTHAPARCSLR